MVVTATPKRLVRVNSTAVTPEKIDQREDKGAIPDLKLATSKDYAEILSLIDICVKARKVLEIPEDTNISEEDFLKIIGKECKQAVVFRGLASKWDCVKKWGRIDNIKTAAESEEETLPHRKYRTFIADDSLEGRLHLTDGKSKPRMLSLKQFISSAVEGSYLLGIHEARGNSTYCPVMAHPDDKEIQPPLAADVPEKVDIVEWFTKQFGSSYDHQQFFLTKGYAFTDLHYDSYDNFYVAVAGTRRWTIAPPELARYLVESSGGALKSGSQAVPHKKLWGSHPAVQLFPFPTIELNPGDMLFLPACFWHLVESVPGASGFSCAFNYFFSKDANEVIGQVGKNVKTVEEAVSENQSFCRKQLAKTSKSQVCDLSKPSLLNQSQWDSVKSTLAVCDRPDLLEPFRNLFTSHDSVFEQYAKETVLEKETAAVRKETAAVPEETAKKETAKKASVLEEPKTPKKKN